MKTRIPRREFLIRAAQGFGGFALQATLFQNLLGQVLQRAYAQTGGSSLNPAGYYVHLSFPGGPPRWMFDLALTPGGQTNQNFKAGSFGTVINNSAGGPVAEYFAQKIVAGGRTLFLPPVWSMNTSQQNFSAVLEHSLLIRGLDMEINNHSLSNGRQTAPTIGGYSLNGVVADASNRPIPCITDNLAQASRVFRGKKGFAPSVINYAETTSVNPISTLLTPFKDFTAGRAAHSATPMQLQEQVLKQFEKYARLNGLTSSSLPQMYDNAMALVEQNVFQLSSQWVPTVAKYRALIQNAIDTSRTQMPGLFDKSVPVQNTSHFNYLQDGTKLKMADARDIVSETLRAPRMAENFAVAEILLDSVTPTLSLGFNHFDGVKTGNGSTVFSPTHDQHFLGSVPTTLLNTLYYRCILNCLGEFVSALKAKGIFDRTVLHIGSEFNRTPRTDGAGSDHNFNGSSALLISGMIRSPSVVGNIELNDVSASYKGTIGIAKNYSLEGFNRPIQVNDVSRTVSTLLGVDDIVTNGFSLLQVSNGIASVKKEEANNG